ncbi:NTP transferase domain-containing protein [Candidatus Uhrbacteria bacterium]|jgi:mannose-1-phosphate guanylyltransferase|nr:NTP transferase domain-containing protein [Candidatus Uhrbacteria bacterium]
MSALNTVDMKAILLAGGAGTRMWPMSRSNRPKQFFNIVGDQILVRDAYERLAKSFAPEDIYISTSPEFASLLSEHFPEVEDDHIIIEPEKRDTGPAMGYVAAHLMNICPDEPIVFVPSDHYINDEELFLRCLKVGADLIIKTGKLLDIAIPPVFPSTAMGYTKVASQFETIEDIEVFEFAGHTEKPNYEVAKQYLQDGSYFWHANYYMWTPRAFLDAFDRYAPETGALLRKIQKTGDNALYSEIERISFDYAVTEKMDTQDVLIIRGDFGWSDIGAWDSLHDRLCDEEGGNVTKGKVVCVDTKRSLVYGPPEKLVTIVGLEGVVVVDTSDALLVCKLEDSQRLKEVRQILKDQNHNDYL